MLIGIVCSVSVVSADDINDTAVEIQSNDATINVDELRSELKLIQRLRLDGLHVKLR